VIIWLLVLEIWDLINRYALCDFATLTGLHADTTDIMAEMEGFGKGSQLFVTPKMIEIFSV
jgi:hypothetical protein